MANIKVEDSFFSIAREIKTRLTSGGAAGGVPEPAIKLGKDKKTKSKSKCCSS